MDSNSDDAAWPVKLKEWLEPFLSKLKHEAQRHWAGVYILGLIGPGERKSIEPMAARVAPGQKEQLHHFLSESPWDPAPLERVLVEKANELVGGPGSVLVIDDVSIVKKGQHSVGVAHQYCGQLGKQANCQVLVSLTLARDEIPICTSLRLYLPEIWTTNPARRLEAQLPIVLPFKTKWQIALEEIDRVIAAGARFDWVLGDTEYGKPAAIRAALSARKLTYILAIPPSQKVYSCAVTLGPPSSPRGRHPIPSEESQDVATLLKNLPMKAWQRLTWRYGSQEPLAARFTALRVRAADGPAAAQGQHLPGDVVWLVGEWRDNGERKYYFSNAPADTPLLTLAQRARQRWVCEQGHQQMKEELGLDHCECRNWWALHHHTLLTMMALCFLQYLRIGEKNQDRAIRLGRGHARTSASPIRAGNPPSYCSGP